MIVSVIFAVLLAAAFACYVSGNLKKIRLLEIISLSLCIPFMAGVAFPLLILHFPDSHHIMSISGMAIFFAEIMILLKALKPMKNNFLEELCLIISLVFWILIYNSIFNFYRCHIAIDIVFTILWLFYFIFFVVKTHLKKFIPIAEFLVMTAFTMSLFYICLASIIYGHTLDTLFCFIGSSAFVFYTGFNLIDQNNESEKKPFQLLENLLIILGTLFMYAGTVLMHF